MVSSIAIGLGFSTWRGSGEPARLSKVDALAMRGAVVAAVARVTGRWGGIDGLVNNAGYGVIEPFLESTHAAWTRTLALNVTALAMCCKAAGRVMREQRSGRIVNITSPGSRMALPDYTAYTASKAGVDSITRALAVALAPYGVLVNSLAPGMMDTEMQRSTEEDLARRDFTVNAIAYEPTTHRIVDPHGGIADLEKGVLRAVGDPLERFTEDGLRVLRGARFVATLELEREWLEA